MSSRPFGVYLHFPFCSARCPYCAFYFVVGRADAREDYVAAMEAEIGERAADPRFAGREARTIYFGGGTPSLLDGSSVARLIERVTDAFGVAAGAEVTLEANPDGLGEDRLDAFRRAGVNRLTLGWQSLMDDELRGLGRTHRREDNVRSIELARAAGLDNVAIDMIFGLPGQSTSGWTEQLAHAASLGPDHVSAYELTMEEGTRFFRRHGEGRLELPRERVRAEMFEATEDVLGRAGIRRYEISNFARPGFECRHNFDGWQGGDLLGFGASAASHVGETRWTNVADLDEYVARVGDRRPVQEEPEVLDEGTWAAEDLYLGLRTVRGVEAARRLARVPEPACSRLAAVLEEAERSGLAHRDGERLALTRRGRLFADSVFEGLLAPESPPPS